MKFFYVMLGLTLLVGCAGAPSQRETASAGVCTSELFWNRNACKAIRQQAACKKDSRCEWKSLEPSPHGGDGGHTNFCTAWNGHPDECNSQLCDWTDARCEGGGVCGSQSDESSCREWSSSGCSWTDGQCTEK